MTRANAFDEKLAEFKADEKPEVVLLVADNPDLIRLCVAWTNTAVRPKENQSALKGSSSHDTWQWLLDNAEYGRRDLTQKSGASSYGFDGKLRIAIESSSDGKGLPE